MVVTLGQQHNVGEKPTVTLLYTYINHHAQPTIINNITTVIYSYENDTNVNNSTIKSYKNRGLA